MVLQTKKPCFESNTLIKNSGLPPRVKKGITRYIKINTIAIYFLILERRPDLRSGYTQSLWPLASTVGALRRL